MQPGLSVYLDLLRWIAAIMVVAGHLLTHPYWVGVPVPGIDFHNDAVIIFFVISGLVIAFVTETRERQFGIYLRARLARLWSVALPALILTIMFDAIGLAARPEAYWFAPPDPLSTAVNAVFSALFANQFYVFGTPFQPGSNIPYWSMSYELVYYLLFGVTFLMRGWRRWIWAALIATLAGYRILLLLPIWMLGVLVWRLRALPVPRAAGWFLSVGSVMLYIAMAWSGLGQWLGAWGDRLLLPDVSLDWSHSVLWKYCLGLLVALHLLGMASITARMSFGRLIPLFRWAGSTTFTLYLLHFPLINVLNAVLPLPEARGPRLLILAACALPAMCVLSATLEGHRAAWRNWLDKGWARLAQPRT